MSHHFDSPTAIEDGRLNVSDVYAFEGAAGTTALVLTVNPDAGRSSPSSFRSDAVYQFSLDTRGGTHPDLTLSVTFGDPDERGRQSARVRYATGAENGEAVEIGHGNVTAIVLEIPHALLGLRRVSVWATIHLHGHGPDRQVSRMGQPMLRPLFFNAPGPATEELNAAGPTTDRGRHRRRLVAAAAAMASLAGLDSDVHARSVADAFLPDVLGYTAGAETHFPPGGADGRSLTDDAFGVSIAFLTRQQIAGSPPPTLPSPAFPYLGRPDEETRVPLAELFGLRPAGATPTSAHEESARPA